MRLITEIEKKYYKELNKIDNWPYLRRIIGTASINIDRNIKKLNKAELNNFRLKQIINSLKGIKNIFKKYDIIIFGLTDNLRKVDEYYIDRFCHDIIINSKSLYVEQKDLNKSRKVLYTRVSFFLFRIIASFSSVKLKSNIFLKKINRQYNFQIDFDIQEAKFNALCKVFKLYFKIVKPKKIVVTCYSFQAVVKAANDLNIDTLEFQHGVINNNYAYDFKKINKNNFCPKKIIVFGKSDKQKVLDYNYADKVIIGGNFFQNYVKNNFNLNSTNECKTKICVTLQDPYVNELTDIILSCASRNEHFDFILVPRNIIPKVSKNIKNVKFLNQYNLYEIMKMSDYHITSYSSSCFEAPSFGLQNFFINLNGLSNFYFKDFIEKNYYNEIFNDEDDLSFYLSKISKNKIKNKIILANENYFSSYNYNDIINV